MSDCCTPEGYRRIFSEKNARGDAKGYRKNGLDKTSQRIFDLLKARGVEGATVLEVGGGIGAIQIELLKAGAAKAVSIELTPTYEEVAKELVREAGLEDRVERRVMDFANAGDAVEAADIVILNRVICCYPDMPKLAGAAADHTKRLLVMSFPREWTSVGIGIANFGMWALRQGFHIFVHPHKQIAETAAQHGLKRTTTEPGFIWQVAAFQKV